LSGTLHHVALLARSHALLLAPVVLLAVGLVLAAAPVRTVTIGVMLVALVHFGVVPVPGQVRHQVAVEDGAATTRAVACHLGAIGDPVMQCPPIVIQDPFHEPFRITP
jgi:hypothetical protein